MPEPTLPVNVAALAALSPAHVHPAEKQGDAPTFAATMAEVSSHLGARREAPGAGKKTPTAGASESGTTEAGSDGEGRLDQSNASAPDAPASEAAAFLPSQPHVEAIQVAAAPGELEIQTTSQMPAETVPAEPSLEIGRGRQTPGGTPPTSGPFASDPSDVATQADASRGAPSPREHGRRQVGVHPAASLWHVATGAARSRAAAASENAAAGVADGQPSALASTGRGDQEPLTAAATELSRDGLVEALRHGSARALPAASTAAPDASFGIAPAGAGVVAPGSAGSATAQFVVQTPPSAPGFAEDFAHRVAWLLHDKVHAAEIAVTPPDLGPVSVTVQMRGTEATLIFRADQAITRSAIEDALPRLRDMLDAQGLQLADARVDTRAKRDDPRDWRHRPRLPVNAAEGLRDSRDLTPVTDSAVSRPRRLIDVIA